MYKPNIFEHLDYKKYVAHWIEARPAGGRGERSRIAEAARCHPTFVSQVLNGSAHFSLEQAEALNPLFEHSEDEGDFFILLLEFGRAGTDSLRKLFQRRIQRALNERLVLKNRLRDHKALNREDQATYYSHWAYCAAHMAVMVPKLQSPAAIAKYLGLSLSQTMKVLEFLESVGLIERSAGRLISTDYRIHLESDSPMIAKHHTNWRMQAIQSLDFESPLELHYSSIMGISRKDLPAVREILVKAIEQVRAIVRESDDEEIYCYNFDLFGLDRNR